MNERRITSRDHLKTDLIKRIEYERGSPVEELIKEGSVRDVGRILGVSHGVIAIWRKLFEIKNNPLCEGCEWVSENCVYGECENG